MDAPPTTALVLPTVTKQTRKRSSLFILISRVVLASWVLRETFNILSTWMEWQFMGSDLVPDSFDLWEEKMTVVHVSTTMNTTALANMTDVKPVAESSSNKIRGGIKASEANSVVIQKFQTAKASTATTFNTTLDLVERSILHQEPPFNISVAVCFKTLFGDIDIGIVIQWAAYNILLGFDHIYMWYRPEMEQVPRFDELRRLPYVTLTLNTQGNRDNYYVQWKTEQWCLSDPAFAAKHDWAMVNDIDEYLWFPQHMGIKDFLAQQPSHYTYLSFPKRMYTLDHRPDLHAWNHKIDMSRRDEFAVSKYPFYLDNFCYSHLEKKRGNPYCPTWKGRAKVIVRPQNHTKIDVHGNIGQPDPDKGLIHFAPNVARFLEWPSIFGRHNVTNRDPVPFWVEAEDDVHIHNLLRGFKADDKRGRFRLQHDDNLTEWFDYVANRFVPGNDERAQRQAQ